ncbi:MAG: hypothetical protein SGJ16_09205 [Nitrospirota bacterium]|nr:hypothetical protein [Nitrospirota bacterium]
MYKHSALLSIGAALLFSLFFVDISQAFQTDRKKDAGIVMAGEMNGTANLSSTQVSITPNPCTVGGKGRTGAPGKKLCPSGSGEQAIAGSRYASQVATTPNPCTVGGKGRTGAPCTKQSLSGSGNQATDGRIVMASDMSGWTGVPSPAVVILFVTGLIALAGLSLRGLRHHHGHHA